MKYCPRCREEFEDTATRCEECDAELMDRRPPDPAPHEEAVVLNVEGLTEAELVRGILVEEGIPARIQNVEMEVLAAFQADPPAVMGLNLLVPCDHLDQARAVLRERNIHETVDAWEVEALARNLLGCDAGAASLRGPAEAMAGRARNFRWAVFHALAREDQGDRRLLDLLEPALGMDDPHLGWELARFLNGLCPQETRQALAGRLARGAEPTLRLRVAEALGHLRGVGAEKDLVALLSDPSEDVRDTTLDALFFLTGRTFDFDPSLPPQEGPNAEALALWHASVNA